MISTDEIFENVRTKHPLIHNITNYVTANDCANIVIACGAAPIMADDGMEVEEITSKCAGLAINMGTLNERTVKSMIIAGEKSNELRHPVVLDPVGVGASSFRMDTARHLLSRVKFSVIRGNISEIKTLERLWNSSENSSISDTASMCEIDNTTLTEHGTSQGIKEITVPESSQRIVEVTHCESSRGVDAAAGDMITEHTLEANIGFLKKFSSDTGAVIAVTGKIDIVTDGDKTFCIRNGHSMMGDVTGTGCQLTSLIAAFVCANPGRTLEAAASAVCAMGLAGEIAHERLSFMDGNASYRNYIIDAIYNMTPSDLSKGAKYEIR